MTFIIRITRDSARRVSGTVERVRTGEKEQFTDTAGVGLVIERMLESDHRTTRRRRRTQEEEA